MIWHFRVATLGTHAVIWTTLGLGFGAVAERCARAAAPQQVRIEHPALARARLGPHAHDLVGDLGQPPEMRISSGVPR